MAEQISIPILTPGANESARNIKQVGDAAAGTGAKLDFAAASLKAFNDATAKAARADQSSVAALRSHAKASSLLADAENVLAGRATVTTRLMADQGRQLEKTGASASAAKSGFAALAGGNVSGMGAAIGAGVALSPILATVGLGLGGLGLAALGAGKHSKQLAADLAPLKTDFASFQKQLQPTVLTDFAAGATVARTALHGLEPVSKATGTALAQVLGQVNREFQSSTWQDFFGFMGRTAGPDVRLLGADFVGLADVLPGLLKALQPVASTLLKIVGGGVQTLRVLEVAGEKIAKFHPQGQENIFQKIGDGLHWLENNAPAGHKSIGVLIEDWLGMNKAASGAGAAASAAAPKIFTLVNTSSGLNVSWGTATAKAAPLTDSITRMGAAAEITFRKAGPVTDQITRLGTSSGAAAGHVTPLTDAITMTAVANEKAFRTAGPLTDAITRLAIPAKAAAGKLADIGKAIQGITAKESTALSAMTGYNDALIGQYNSAAALNVALRASHDRIGLNTQKQRDSFGAADTYISQTLAAAKAAGTNSGKIDDVIASLHNELPKLEDAKGGTRAYWQEVKTLVGWLDTLKNLKAIHEAIFVSGNGTFTVKAGTRLGLPGGTAGGPFAAGGLVGGHGSGDTVPAMLTPGEAVVPRHLTPAVAPFLRANKVPGFAAGGLVPSYGGSVAGLVPWSRRDLNATVRIDEQAVARATLAGMRAAASAAQSSPGFGVAASGPLQSYARKLLAAYGWSAMWPAFADIVARESGWNTYATNPSSGAYGIPQALPGYKMASAGADWRTNGFTQLRWMMGYIKSRWNDPWSADLNERTQHWYDRGGWLPPGRSVAYNGTGRPEMVVPGRGGGVGNVNYNINVHADATVHPADIGRAIVEKIREHERRNGANWRK